MSNQRNSAIAPEELREISDSFEDKPPERILEWGFDRFGEGLVLATSFGGASGTVLLDMAAKINPNVKVYYLDTDFLFPETHQYVGQVRKRYGIEPVAYKSHLTPEQQAAQYGDELWLRDPDLCCDLRKVQPNARALGDVDAWVSGIRRDQAQSREHIGLVEWDPSFDLVKINPVAHRTKNEIWSYILDNKLEYNVLLDRGYKSIGCTHCTNAVGADAGERDGRWAGTGKVECGLHVKPRL